MNQPITEDAPKRNMPLLVLTGIVAVGSALGIMVVMTQVLRRHAPWEDIVSLALGLWLISIVPIGTLRKAALPGIGFDGMGIVAWATPILQGLVLIAPAMTPAEIDRGLLYAAAMVVTVLSLMMGLAVQRHTDELLREVTRETAVWTLTISQTALLAYSLASWFGFMPAMTPWGIYLLSLVAYFTAMFVVIFRRGLDRQPQG